MKVSRLMVVAALLCGLVWLCGGIAQAFECKGGIGDYVWVDADKDGIQDTGENGLPGVVVHLFEYDWNTDVWSEVLPAQVTDGTGYYLFADRPDTDFRLDFELPAGYAWTLQDQGVDDAADSDVNQATGETVQFDLLCDELDLSWDAGVVQVCKGSIGDYVWLDGNKNGLQDDGADAGVAGVFVSLYNAADSSEVATTTTDAGGYYLFSDVEEGSYYVVFELPTGYTWTTQDAGDNAADSDVDASGFTATFALPCNANDLTWDAGLVTSDFSNPGCGTPGYWKNHPEAWPVASIVIGGRTYTKAQAITIIKKSTTKDMSTVMFSHLVCAKLNVLIGNSDLVVGPYIVAGDAWMAQHPAGSKVTAASAAWKVGEPIKNMLDAYNNGLLDAPHRD